MTSKPVSYQASIRRSDTKSVKVATKSEALLAIYAKTLIPGCPTPDTHRGRCSGSYLTKWDLEPGVCLLTEPSPCSRRWTDYGSRVAMLAGWGRHGFDNSIVAALTDQGQLFLHSMPQPADRATADQCLQGQCRRSL